MLGAERYRFTVEEFDRMAEAGVLAEDSRVELLAGEIIQMPPIGARHAACVEGAVAARIAALDTEKDCG